MEFSDVIKKRGSFRGPFTGEKIPRQELQNIVEAGIAAPSGCNAQTTSFVIVDEEQLVRQIAAITGKDYINQAGAVIVVVADQTPAYGSMSFYKEDAAAATENILLAIADGGWASVWLDGILRVGGIAEKIAALLAVPKGKNVQIVLPVGRPKEPVTQREKLPFDKRAWFNRYGG